MATTTKPKAQIEHSRSANSTFIDGTRVALPIYVGVSGATAKAILSHLRSKAGTGAANVVTPGGITVEHAGESMEERAMVNRLRIDLHTLRSLLFGSDTRGVSLDLALRIQAEIEDSFVFVTEEMVREAFESSLAHYKFHGPKN